MSADPAHLTREAIHALVDQLDDESLEPVLVQIEDLLSEHDPLTAQQMKELRTRLAARVPGNGVPHEEAARSWGLRD